MGYWYGLPSVMALLASSVGGVFYALRFRSRRA